MARYDVKHEAQPWSPVSRSLKEQVGEGGSHWGTQKPSMSDHLFFNVGMSPSLAGKAHVG